MEGEIQFGHGIKIGIEIASIICPSWEDFRPNSSSFLLF